MQAAEQAQAPILLVDDHPANLLALEAVLSPLGQPLVRAGTGKEALAWLEGHACAVVLLDVQLPDVDGFEVARRLKALERHRHTPIIFVTATDGATGPMLQGYARGAVDYLVKPFDPDILLSKVSVFVDLYLQQQALAQHEAQLQEARTRGRQAAFAALRAEVGAALASADGLAATLQRCAEAVRASLGVSLCGVWLLDVRTGLLRLEAGAGTPPEGEALPPEVAPGQGRVGRIATGRRPCLLLNSEEAAEEDTLPPSLPAFAGCPLQLEERLVGVLAVFSDAPLDASTPAMLGTLADTIAQGVERQRAEGDLRFLVEAGELLASSLDYEEVLQRVTRLMVPRLADWSAVDVLQPDGSLRRLSLHHRDPQKVQWLAQLESRFPLTRDSPGAIGRVLRSGRPELVPDVTEESLAAAVRNREHLELVRHAGFRSLMVLPLAARGRQLGVLCLIAAESGRRYGEADLRLAMDLSHRASLAVDNALLYRESQEAIRLRDEFLSVASHELRTPLTPLSLKLQRLAHDVAESAPPELRLRLTPHLEVMQRQVKRLCEQVGDLLDVSRLGSGQVELVRARVDLVEVARAVLDRRQAQAARVGSSLVLHAPTPVEGSWDGARLEQVLDSLLSNALKYGMGQPVEVRVEALGERAVLSVRDEGIGIAPEALSRIFERFARAVSERHYGGLGLGLYLIRRIVEAHGGQVSVQSAPGAGALFRVELPRGEAGG